MAEIEVKSINGMKISDEYARSQIVNRLSAEDIDDGYIGTRKLWSSSKTSDEIEKIKSNQPHKEDIDRLTNEKADKDVVQMYKLTNDDGEINYITSNGLDIFKLAPGNYACVASRFTNPPIPSNTGYVDINVRQNTNSTGTRKVITVWYIYEERMFVGQKHHSYDYVDWKEVTFESSGCNYSQPFYLNEVESLYKKVLSVQNSNTKSIGFITDIHYIRNTRGVYSFNGLRHIDQIVSFGNGVLDAIVIGGDTINGKGDNNELITELMDINSHTLKSNIPIYMCKGNHDNGTWKIDNQVDKKYDGNIITNQQWNKIVSSKYSTKYGFKEDPNNIGECCYAYYDFNDVKLRIIMLDVADHRKSDITDSYGDVNINTTTFCIGQKQLDWLTNTALKLPESNGWSVLVFSHYPPYNHLNLTSSKVRNGNLLQGVLSAFKNKTTYSASNTTNSYGATVNCNFTGTNHGLAGICYGHYHEDNLAYKDFNYISCDSSANRDDVNPLNRANGTVNEDCWTVLTVDTSLKKIHIHRFGYNKNFEKVINF